MGAYTMRATEPSTPGATTMGAPAPDTPARRGVCQAPRFGSPRPAQFIDCCFNFRDGRDTFFGKEREMRMRMRRTGGPGAGGRLQAPTRGQYSLSGFGKTTFRFSVPNLNLNFATLAAVRSAGQYSFPGAEISWPR